MCAVASLLLLPLLHRVVLIPPGSDNAATATSCVALRDFVAVGGPSRQRCVCMACYCSWQTLFGQAARLVRRRCIAFGRRKLWSYG